MTDSTPTLQTVACPRCGDIVMHDFLATHITCVHPSVPRPAKSKSKAQHGKPKKKGKQFAGGLLPTIKVNVRSQPQPQVKRGKGLPIPKTGPQWNSLRGLRVVTSSSSSGSSMFGGAKPTWVSIVSGGLPGLGKRR